MEEEKPNPYNPEAWSKLREEGHIMNGACPCGNNHEMTDGTDKKKAPSKPNE